MEAFWFQNQPLRWYLIYKPCNSSGDFYQNDSEFTSRDQRGCMLATAVLTAVDASALNADCISRGAISSNAWKVQTYYWEKKVLSHVKQLQEHLKINRPPLLLFAATSSPLLWVLHCCELWHRWTLHFKLHSVSFRISYCTSLTHLPHSFQDKKFRLSHHFLFELSLFPTGLLTCRAEWIWHRNIQQIPGFITCFHRAGRDATGKQWIHTGYWFPTQTG